MTHWYEMINTIIIIINLCNAMKINCALMFIKRKSLWKKMSLYLIAVRTMY